MADANSYSGDEYTDDEEDGEELDPRVQDELERLNVAANSINHLEAELDEARAVFQQTIAAATHHLNTQTKKLGHKNIQKARPFYDVLRQMRKAHIDLQKATLQYEKANSRHVYARQRVRDAEHRVFSCGEKRAFDTALQEMLNQATIEVNEAENQKKESWLTHQEMYKSYQDVEKKAKEMQNKLKKSIEKAKPYFVQKVGFDRHLWQLKLRVDSIQKGLSEAKVNYSKCLRSLETISDDIHQKRKDKKTMAMIANLQERGAGVGADSEDEMSLDQSQLDLDLDCDASLSEVDGIVPADNLPDLPTFVAGQGAYKRLSEVEASSSSVEAGLGNLSLESASMDTLDRKVSGAESFDLQTSLASGTLKREVYGCEQGEEEPGECSSKEEQTKDTERIKEESDLKTNDTSLVRNEGSENLPDGDIAEESVKSLEDNLNPNQPEATTGFHERREDVETVDSGGDSVQSQTDDALEGGRTVESEVIVIAENTQSRDCRNGDSETHKTTNGVIVMETGGQQTSQSGNSTGNQSDSKDVSETTDGESEENGVWI